MTIRAIKDAIRALPESDRLELENWLGSEWDSEVERDFSAGGRGVSLLDQVDAEIDAGKFQEWDR